MSNYAKIKKYDIANGVGIRTSIFFSGCSHECFNCFNSELWDFNYGNPIGIDVMNEIDETMNEHIRGLSILGGEAMHPKNVEDLYTLTKTFKEHNPSKDIWLWTGYTWEELFNRESEYINEITKAVLQYIDVLIDGKYVDELRDLTLAHRGSSNQRVIDVRKSLKSSSIVLYEE